jgi:hypothetical protein
MDCPKGPFGIPPLSVASDSTAASWNVTVPSMNEARHLKPVIEGVDE